MKLYEIPKTKGATWKHGLPKRCECGGVMSYVYDHGRVFSCCETCTPVHRLEASR